MGQIKHIQASEITQSKKKKKRKESSSIWYKEMNFEDAVFSKISQLLKKKSVVTALI